MTRTALTAVVVLMAVLGPGRAGAEERSSRVRVSQSGQYSIKLVQASEGACRVEVTKDSAAAWQLDKCVGGVDDLYFVSDDGERFWVFKTLPEKGKAAPKVKRAKGRKAQRAFAAWTYANVAVEYDRQGNVLQAKKLNDFVQTPNGLNNVRQLKKHFTWLQGVSGVPGNPPRLNKDGKVEFDTLEPRNFQLAF